MDHLILYADYKTPDMHSHLAAHLLLVYGQRAGAGSLQLRQYEAGVRHHLSVD